MGNYCVNIACCYVVSIITWGTSCFTQLLRQMVEAPAFLIEKQFTEFGNVLESNVEKCTEKSRNSPSFA
jgi:hypothetical protein